MRKSHILAAMLLAAPVCAAASELGDQFSAAAAEFVEAGRSRGLEGAALAVFPFQADEKLSKKRVDFAVGELLANELLRANFYKLTERAQLESVMREQKLGLSGAVDSRTAAGIGKLLGARLLVLGNVTRLGKSYQITSKLVDAESAEMLASRVSEVPVETFDQEAGRYLTLVPERQAIGIFLGLGYGQNSTKKLGPQAYDGTLTLRPLNADLPEGIASLGVRYWVKPRWMVQLDYSSLFNNLGGVAKDLYSANLVPTSASRFKTGYTGFRLRASLDRGTRLSGPFTWYNGAGLAFSVLDNIDMDKSDNRSEYPGGYVVTPDSTNNTKYFTPYLRTGLEWRPQERFGWSVFANLNLLAQDYEQGVTVSKAGGQERQLTLWKVTLPRFYVDTSLALYF